MKPQNVLDEPDSYAVCAGTSALFMELAASPRVHDTPNLSDKAASGRVGAVHRCMCSLIHSCSADNLHHENFAISTDKGTAAAAAGWRTCWRRARRQVAAIPLCSHLHKSLDEAVLLLWLADVLAQGHSISASEKACIC